MRLPSQLAAIGLAFVLGACSTESKKSEESPAPEATPQLSDGEKRELEAEFQSIPAAAIIRVPVDEAGNPTGAPEMRIYDGPTEIAGEEAIVEAFEGGSAPQALVGSADELDGDTSTQAWYDYNRCRYTVTVHCKTVYNHNYWYTVYRPKLYWKGYTWSYGYGRPRWYQHHNYRYYCYNRYRYW